MLIPYLIWLGVITMTDMNTQTTQSRTSVPVNANLNQNSQPQSTTGGLSFLSNLFTSAKNTIGNVFTSATNAAKKAVYEEAVGPVGAKVLEAVENAPTEVKSGAKKILNGQKPSEDEAKAIANSFVGKLRELFKNIITNTVDLVTEKMVPYIADKAKQFASKAKKTQESIFEKITQFFTMIFTNIGVWIAKLIGFISPKKETKQNQQNTEANGVQNKENGIPGATNESNVNNLDSAKEKQKESSQPLATTLLNLFSADEEKSASHSTTSNNAAGLSFGDKVTTLLFSDKETKDRSTKQPKPTSNTPSETVIDVNNNNNAAKQTSTPKKGMEM